MNIIDALYISLGLDTSDYEKKKEGVMSSLKTMGEASDKTTKTIAESGKKAANAFSLLKVEVLGALAAFGVSTGFKDFIQSNMNGQAALGRMSANLGISTQRLEAWKLAAREVGVSGEDALGALQSVAKGVAEAQVNQSSPLSQAALKYKFAIDPMSAENTLININKRASEIHDRQKALMMFNEAGVGALSNVLIQSPEKFQAQFAHTMSLVGAATQDSTEKAAKLQAEWADLEERFNQISEKIFNELSPALIDLGKRFADWLDKVNWDHVAQVVGNLTERITKGLNSVNWDEVGKGISTATDEVGEFASTFDRLTASYRKFADEWDSSLFGRLGKAASWYHDKSVGVADWLGGIVARKSASISQGATESDVRERGSPSDKAYRYISQILGFNPDTGNKIVAPDAPNNPFDSTGKWSDIERQQGLPAGLLYRIEQQESGGKPNAVSPKGALGAFQMLPSTAAQYGLKGNDIFDPKKEALAAAMYLRDLLKRYNGNLIQAVAAYNEGPGNLEKYGIANAETQNYVRSVLGKLGPFPGAKIPSDALLHGRGQPSKSDNGVSVTIQKMEINAPQAKNSRDIAQGMGEAIRKNTLIMGLNSSLA